MAKKARKAKNPKAKPIVSLASGCLRYHGDGEANQCRMWSHCVECWFDAGEKVKDQIERPTWRVGRVAVSPHVESGIHLLADLISRMQAATTGFESPPITSSTGVDTFKSDFFIMRPFSSIDSENVGGDDFPNFYVPTDDVAVWWYKHAGRECFMSRHVKGREWTTIMVQALVSIQRGRML